MKLVHLSDLHLGKRFGSISLIEDQKYILTQVLQIIDGEKPDGICIAGDVYDKGIPSVEAMDLLNDFLVNLSSRNIPVWIISGNHDSAERLTFGHRLIERSGIYFAPAYQGKASSYAFTDQYGTVRIYLLPFVKPVHIRQFFPDAEIHTYTDALAIAIQAMNINPAERNILVTHQFVTGAARCDSEDVSVGGSDNVDASVFDAFDYVALGHIHGPQSVQRETMRYCGTLLKYSFSEVNHKKSVTIVELGKKGDCIIREIPVRPKRDMAALRGSYAELTNREFYQNTSYTRDFLQITLTDEEDVPDAMRKLRIIYPELLELRYDNRRTRAEHWSDGPEEWERKSPLDLLEEFYEKQNGQTMSDSQRALARSLMEKIWEDETE